MRNVMLVIEPGEMQRDKLRAWGAELKAEC